MDSRGFEARHGPGGEFLVAFGRVDGLEVHAGRKDVLHAVVTEALPEHVPERAERPPGPAPGLERARADCPGTALSGSVPARAARRTMVWVRLRRTPPLPDCPAVPRPP
jgi:hypothetical protein